MKRLIAALALFALAHPALAEVTEVNLANQYGFGHLTLTTMKGEKLIEKHAASAGIPLKPNYFNTQGSATMAEALISGSADFISLGVTGFVNIWDKTKGGAKAVGPVSAIPMYLVTTNPNVKTVKDFTEADRIAVPAVKVSPQALFLQIAAGQELGEANFDKLDKLTVALSHPDALAALKTGAVSAHFTPPPFQTEELKLPNAKIILKTADVFGGETTQVVLASTSKWHDANPKAFAVVVAAWKEAQEINRTQPRRAAKSYIRETGDKIGVDEAERQIRELSATYEITPRNTLSFIDFMVQTGVIKTRPVSWKDIFFPEIHDLPGS